MKVETVKKVDGKFVELIGRIRNIELYQSEYNSEENSIVYMIVGDEVIGSMNIEVDVSERIGLINKISVEEVRKESAHRIKEFYEQIKICSSLLINSCKGGNK
jgi:hypothetical protein